MGPSLYTGGRSIRQLGPPGNLSGGPIYFSPHAGLAPTSHAGLAPTSDWRAGWFTLKTKVKPLSPTSGLTTGSDGRGTCVSFDKAHPGRAFGDSATEPVGEEVEEEVAEGGSGGGGAAEEVLGRGVAEKPIERGERITPMGSVGEKEEEEEEVVEEAIGGGGDAGAEEAALGLREAEVGRRSMLLRTIATRPGLWSDPLPRYWRCTAEGKEEAHRAWRGVNPKGIHQRGGGGGGSRRGEGGGGGGHRGGGG
uniref:Uncharacterized protein n=1 Tax=Ananas comosus var. bracteatus TaxID=296719 RepID=A0A6V7PGZ9_ANACO|nr:unnamed protein product [Ananas comosus var. bracteatus]